MAKAGRLFELAALLQQPQIVEDSNPTWLADYISASCNWEALSWLSKRPINASSALTVFAELERTTLLFLMHLIPRKRYRNRYGSGIQQSYGDHNRLLMLGLDRIMSKDWQWFVSRSNFVEEEFVARLQTYVQQMSDHLLSNDILRRTVIISAALHDYGKLYRRGFGLDSYDAIYLSQRIVQSLSSDNTEREMIKFCIRNHDLVEHVHSGVVPVRTILEPLKRFDDSCRSLCLSALSAIQVAGAASLGNGRLTQVKLRLGCELLAGDFAKTPGCLVTRFNRLMFSGMNAESQALSEITQKRLSERGLASHEEFARFGENVILRNWQALEVDEPELELARLNREFDVLAALFETWQRQPIADIVILGRDLETYKIELALSGDSFLTVGSQIGPNH